jgi:hypothetical protein
MHASTVSSHALTAVTSLKESRKRYLTCTTATAGVFNNQLLK